MKGPQTVSLLGGFGWSAHMRSWAVLDGLHSKELKKEQKELTKTRRLVNLHNKTSLASVTLSLSGAGSTIGSTF